MIKPLLVLLFALTFAISPFFTPDFRGYDPSQFPIADRPSILPAAYAFSIWLLIYLYLIAHAAYGLWKRAGDPAWDKVRLALIVTLAIGTAWLAVAVQNPVWASVLIIAMLIGALIAVFQAPPEPDRWLLLAPIAILAGWLTAASGVSIGVLLTGFGWLQDTSAAVVMLVAVLIVAMTVQLRLTRAPEYGLTVIWALVAVIVANGTANLAVTLLAAIGIAAMAWAAWRVGKG
ncbi:MAG: hypothetical protein DI533_03875 [Cereibacter sphaeroides]|uniref:Uncharacterized protein n=1 Tax=Cereibacter sphaeroides TaxID=1063 RepID=A0A2W5U8Y9_CERSP|nr:MAG: hypothetical protein DI533_03875 [Cereibacter sphaeroides]